MRALLALLFSLLVLVPSAGFARSNRPPEPETSIRSWIVAGRYSQADSAAGALLLRTQSKTPVDSLALAHALDLVARSRILGEIGSQEGNEALAEQALRIKETRLRPDDAEIALSSSNVGEALRARGRYADALTAFQRSLTIRDRGGKADDPETAGALNDVAKTLRDLGRTKEARPLFERALAIREQTLDPHDPELATSLANLASVLRDAGKNALAKEMYERALAIRVAAFGHDHPSVARVLQGIAVLLRRSGDYAGARARYVEALAIAQRTLPPGHPELGRYYTSVGAIDYAMADYEAARQAFETDLAITTKALGPEHPEAGTARTNLGVIALELGDYEAAIDHFRAALGIAEKTRGKESASAALILNNMGIALNGLGRYEAADSAHGLSVGIWEKIDGDSSANVAIALEGRADDAAAAGDRRRAQEYTERALAILDHLDPRHPETPGVLENLGSLAEARGDFAGAREDYARALEIRRSQLGSSHPLVARDLNGEARALLALGRTDSALRSALEAEAIRRDHIRSTVRWLPERQALRFENLLPAGLDVAVTAALSLGARDSVVESVWDALVRSRALVLDEMASRRQERSASDLARMADLAVLEARVAECRRRFASLALRGPNDELPGAYQARLDSARGASERAEQDLLARSAAWRRTRPREVAGLAQVVAALPGNAALVSFVRYTDPRTSQPSYAAFVRTPEGRMHTVLVGRASELDRLIERWRARAGRWPSARNGARAEAEERNSSQALRARIWDPLEPLVGKAERVVVVPDAALHLVSFPALRRANGRFLVEQGPTFQVVSTERDLVPADAGARSPGGYLVFGDPDYDAGTNALARGRSLVSAVISAGPDARRGPLPCALSLEKVRWERLPGTEREASDIEQLWSGLAHDSTARFWRLTAASASEEAFKQLAPTARFVHLATHAFFLDACESPSRAGTRGVGGLTPAAAPPPVRPATESVLALDENPLLRSGLVLAGANSIRASPTDTTGEDGIITAEEIAAMDLSSVEGAVLSGCDTGVGALSAGEGILGLRRAFEIAGARSLVLTLWTVSDEAAREWMRSFYQARLVRRASAAEAARDASRAILASRRAAGRSTHPYFWAAFIATGAEPATP